MPGAVDAAADDQQVERGFRGRWHGKWRRGFRQKLSPQRTQRTQRWHRGKTTPCVIFVAAANEPNDRDLLFLCATSVFSVSSVVKALIIPRESVPFVPPQ
jgi:hypothetical protein